MMKISRPLFLFLAITFFAIQSFAQQKFIAYATGPQAGTSSTRHLIVEVTVQPPAMQGNAANLVFQGRGGSTFPAGADTAICATGALACAHVPFSPESSWIFSFDVNSDALANFRKNQFYVTVLTSGFPSGEVKGVIHVANGAYNDYDGDGRTDLQVYRNSNNTFYALHSSSGAYIVQPLGQPGDSVSLTVDFDGDGRMDIGVFRAGVWHILQSSTGTYTQRYWGTSGDAPVLADFDRDGRADVSVARSESGQRVWYTRMTSDGSTRVVTWGLSSDAFFTGRSDFDGDSAADLLVIRNESGQRVFYVLRSLDAQMEIIRWGLSSDVVKLGDYDGDGKTDAAVTRAENGQRVFYIRQSSNGQPRYETFGLAGDF